MTNTTEAKFKESAGNEEKGWTFREVPLDESQLVIMI
jgi:hypothetical protein